MQEKAGYLYETEQALLLVNHSPLKAESCASHPADSQFILRCRNACGSE
jgi:hypothetical protein